VTRLLPPPFETRPETMLAEVEPAPNVVEATWVPLTVSLTVPES
jgi:hypothetical protein